MAGYANTSFPSFRNYPRVGASPPANETADPSGAAALGELIDRRTATV